MVDFRQGENPHYFFTLQFYLLLCRIAHLVQHILNKYTVSAGGVAYEHVGNRAYELAVLNDRRAAHECGQEGTTKSIKKMFLNLCAKVVVNGQMKFLDLVGFGFGYANGNVADF